LMLSINLNKTKGKAAGSVECWSVVESCRAVPRAAYA